MTIDLGWYPPASTWINDLSQVLNGTGTNGFYFGGSELPSGVQYGTYNWCNMPHVRRSEYVVPRKEFELVYVEVVSIAMFGNFFPVFQKHVFHLSHLFAWL
jgi:hypothetical protein